MNKLVAQTDDFINQKFGVIGRSVSTKFEPNTSQLFQFWLADNSEALGQIEIGNIIAAVADDQSDITFGTVVEMRSYSDVESIIADFLSHDFGSADLTVPTDIAEVVVVTCAVMRNLSNKTKPIERSRVFFPSVAGIQFSYGIIDANRKSIFAGMPIPVGLFVNGDGTSAPVSVDENFLLGPEGAHLNVSGISGLAAKTSAVEFIVKTMLSKSSKRIAVVMFNVKGRDLLYVDRMNPRLSGDEDAWSLSMYDAIDVPPAPFHGARVFAPFDSREPGRTVSLRRQDVNGFSWDLKMIYEDIPSLFSSYDWDDKMEGVWYVLQQEIEQDKILTYAQMLSWIEKELNKLAGNNQWLRNQHVATWRKMYGHLRRFPRSYGGLIQTAGQGTDVPWPDLAAGSVWVIDIQPLNDRGQRLVFGRSIRAMSEILEDGSSSLDGIVVVVDELNKFAPSGSDRSPLKERLIDITARGRSLGLVLFGAEQFASSVDREIVDNSSTYLFGRTEANELRSPTYRAFSEEVKSKLSMLPQGELLVKFPKFPQPIFVRFPFPPCLPGDLARGIDDDDVDYVDDDELWDEPF